MDPEIVRTWLRSDETRNRKFERAIVPVIPERRL